MGHVRAEDAIRRASVSAGASSWRVTESVAGGSPNAGAKHTGRRQREFLSGRRYNPLRRSSAPVSRQGR